MPFAIIAYLRQVMAFFSAQGNPYIKIRICRYFLRVRIVILAFVRQRGHANTLLRDQIAYLQMQKKLADLR